MSLDTSTLASALIIFTQGEIFKPQQQGLFFIPPMNVLLYNDEGTSTESVKQTFNCLQRHLSPNYVVSTVSARQLIEEPWAPFTSLLVIPGGADKPYCRELDGAGNNAIRQYVRKGGRFLGICAGGYYGAKQIEFEAGTDIEVSGPRELGFYQGTARGTVYKGFTYNSDTGARAAPLTGSPGQAFSSYFNGGCLFEGDPDAEVIARYTRPFDIESTEQSPAAVVFKKYGKGSFALSGVHFEYELTPEQGKKRELSPQLIESLAHTSRAREEFINGLFREKFGLNVAPFSELGKERVIPDITPLYLSSLNQEVSPNVTQLMKDLYYSMDARTSALYDKADTFKFLKGGVPKEYAGFGREIEAAKLAAGGGLKPSKPGMPSVPTGEEKEEDPQREKTILVYDVDELYPRADETPHFNHSIYFHELKKCIAGTANADHPAVSHLGATMMYGEVVTSTSSMLERNPQLLQVAPDGFAAVGTQQVAGRGRGTNTWVNPVGVMAVSWVMRIKKSQCNEPLVFIQYLCSLALVQAVQSFLPAGVDIGIRLKWPNDIYITNSSDSLVKIGGVMVSCNVIGDEFVVVVGSGTNVYNTEPTTSINERIKQLGVAEPIELERLLARYLTRFDQMLRKFLVAGFKPFSSDYYSVWLHDHAKVTLARHEGVSATITGISNTNGMLLAVDENGNQYELQPDGNSFDVFRGLIRRKA